jgi:hypothetical protein
MLKPQDVLVACKLLALGKTEWTFARLAGSLFISASEVHAAARRCREAGMLRLARGKLNIVRKSFFELLTSGVPQIFFATKGAICLGVPTSVHARPLDGKFPHPKETLVPLVWPHVGGIVRGESLLPIYPTVPRAIERDDLLYETLALVDVMRTGETEDRRIAANFLHQLIWKNGTD